jgi:hypothetical protein
MKVRIGCLIIFLSFSLAGLGKDNLKSFFKKSDAFFQLYVKEGRVEYHRLKENPGDLNALLQNIATISPAVLKDKEFKAYLINVYNILVMHQVIQYGIPLSPMEAEKFFGWRNLNIGGRAMSLNEVRDMIFLHCPDFRIYSALSNGTLGSAALYDHCYKPAGLNRRLNKNMKKISEDRNFVRHVPKASLILLSDIFMDWDKYFSKEDILRKINKYRKEDLPFNFEIRIFPCNGNLNIKI